MKRFNLFVMLFLLTIVEGQHVFGYDFIVDGIFYNKITPSTVEVTSSGEYYKYNGEVTIPESIEYNGIIYSVTSIGGGAFLGCRSLTSVTIPNSVTSIGALAFSNCTGLTSVTIPNSVTSIGALAFNWCTGLTTVTIPNSVTEIGSEAFKNCSSLTTVTIANGVTEIGSGAFQDCSNLSSIKMPNTVASIEKLSFMGCCSLSSIEIPQSVTSIGDEAFKGCSALISLTFPNSVTSIGQNAFYGCSNLTSVTIPNSVTSIGDYAFYNCNSLCNLIVHIPEINNEWFHYSSIRDITLGKEVEKIDMEAFFKGRITSIKVEEGNPVFDSRNNCNAIIETSNNALIFGCENSTIPNSVTVIGSDAFKNCSGLTSVTIPNSVTEIGSNAFQNCRRLTSVTIGNGLNSIEALAFDGCSSLNSVYIRDLAAWCKIEFESNPLSYAHHLYLNDEEVKDLVIPEGIIEIKNAVFLGCSALESVTIPEGVTKINDYAFRNCTGLTSLTVPNSVTSIGGYSFSGCSGLTSMTIPNSVTRIGGFSFSGCSGLTSVTIPNSVTEIGNGAFQNCSGLTSVTIPNSVTEIGSGAFQRCSGLTSVTIPNSVTSIGSYTFDGCSALTSVTIPNSVTEIGNGAFQNCSSLTSVTIPNSVTKIGSNVFAYCSGLTSVTIHEKLTSFGENAFMNVDEDDHYVQHKLYTKKGSATLLALWINGYAVHDVNTQALLEQPKVRFSDITQTTVIANVENYYDEYVYTYRADDGECEQEIKGESYKLTGFRLGNTYKSTLVISSGNLKLYVENPSFTTASMSLVIDLTSTASSVSATASYTGGDAKVVGQTLTLAEESVADNNLTITGLNPATKYVATYTIDVEYGTENKQILQYRTSKEIFTEPLEWNIAQPKVVSLGNVIVSTETNVDDEETNVGFEWRSTDWTEEFPSNTGTAYLYDGTIEGYIKNLNTSKLWKYRPYYLSDSGVYHYGDWMGIDPTNTSYFEPTVHTYSKVTINGNTALIKGYALSGTDEVTVQGFKYWRTNSGGDLNKRVITVPSDAMTVELNNKQQMMTATLKDLEYESKYCCVAFVTTIDESTFYGEEQTFTTGEDPTDIEDVEAGSAAYESNVEVARYNMNGQLITSPQKGVNIIRYSNGSTQKVFVK